MENQVGTVAKGRRVSYYRARVSKNYTTDSSCDPVIEEMRNNFYAELATGFREDTELVNITDCLVERLKLSNLAEIMVKQASLTAANNISRRKRKKLLKALDKTLNKKMEVAITLCVSDEEFGERFDALIDSVTNGTKPEKHYCARQYMIDNNFIDTTVYKMNVNPSNINITGINCQVIIKDYIAEVEDKFKEEYEEDLYHRTSKTSSRCFAKAARSNNVFAFTVKVVMLGELEISDAAKTEEKSIFIEKAKNLYGEMLNC